MNIIIRTDASKIIGTGHLMRCLALAQAMKTNQYKPVFLTNISSSFLEDRLITEGIEFIYIPENIDKFTDIQETIKIAQKLDSKWLIIDGYQFDTEYQKQFKTAGLKVLFFDDYGHCNYYYADLILNQNISADASLYTHRENYTKLLLGTQYAVLRKEFWPWHNWERKIPDQVQKLLVTFGGSDPDNVTFRTIQAIKMLNNPQVSVLVIVGGSNIHYEQLKTACQTSHLPITMFSNVQNMPELMAWADLAIAAGGTTTWELAFMGLPSIVITIADNQKASTQKINEMGLANCLGWHEDVTIEMIKDAIAQLLTTAEKREEMSQKGRNLIDGYGNMRILEQMGLIYD